MKNLKTFALSVLSLFGFAACQQVEIAPDVTPEATHTVTFVAGAPETKTTVAIDENTATFAWTKSDTSRFTLYENGNPASKTTGVLGNDGKMTIKATFASQATGNDTYVAVVNSSNDGQIMSAEAYDEDADILVSRAVSSFDGENGVQLQFKREVAIAKMTLKGLDAGEVVNMVTVSSTADIAGSYGVDGWASPAETSLEISSASYLAGEGYSIEANESGEAVVWFTCIPQDAATLTVKVEAADGDTYTKTFGKPITLNRGDVTSFGVALEKMGWFLVEDAGSLVAGDVIVIVAAGSNVALSTTQNDNNRGQQAITKNANNTVTIGNNVQRLTLGAGTTTGTFSLSTGSGYLYAASSSKNYLRTQTKLDANGSWTITINASKNATITAQGTNTNNLLKYNSSSKLFSCYASGQADVQIYRLMNDTRAAQSISYSAKTGSIDKYTSVKEIPTLDVSGVKTTVSYTSSDATVATISETGEITPVKAGTTTITAIAAASAEYREAKASFVLTVTDSTPYLSATASKTSVEAAGETVTITVDTNVGNWNATSDNAAFVVGEPSGNTVEVTVSENTDASERKATITVKAGTLSKSINLTQKGTGSTDVIETIDFEAASATYTFWTFTNMTSKQTGSITAKGGTYYGTTGGKTTASITTKTAIANPQSITFYVSKQSDNEKSSSWKLQVSSNKSTWTDVKTQSAASMSKGNWVEVTQDLSSYSNMYVRVYYTGSTAVRNIDDLTFTYSE